ncbi:MAG: hypothetical protein QXL51_04190, partial [Candidatus Aenigmatarchaeota archaeon]
GLIYFAVKTIKPITTTTTSITTETLEKTLEKTYTITLTSIQYSTITYTIPPTTITTAIPTTIFTTITTKIKEDLVIINARVGCYYYGEKDVKCIGIDFTPINLGNKKITIRNSSITAEGLGLLTEKPYDACWWFGTTGLIGIDEIDLSPSSRYYNEVSWGSAWVEGINLDPSKVVKYGNYTLHIPYKIYDENNNLIKEDVITLTLTLKWLWGEPH